MKFKTLAAIGMTALFALSAAACGETPSPSGGGQTPAAGYDESLRVRDVRSVSPQEYTVLNLAATDDYGRALLPVDGKENDDRYAGMFFFLWLGQNAESQRGIYDMSKITENGAHPEYFTAYNDATSPVGAAHFWGEPVWGYYNSSDEWVMRKQVEMLTMAGVDFLVLDCTNAFTYNKIAEKLFAVLLEYQNAGWNVPKVMYYIAHDDGNGKFLETLKEVYEFFYRDGTYRSLWFMPDGKPVIPLNEKYYYAPNYGLNLNDPEEKEIYDLFQFRCRQWPNEAFQEDGIPWMEFTPNEFYDAQPVHNGWINVSVAQHITVKFSDIIGTQGRGYDHLTGLTDHARYGEDLNYVSQWQTVLDNKSEARFTFITGWNEWIATKQQSGREYFSVDTFIAEFSRDLEPSENLGDNSYLLTAQKLRENNFTAAKHYQYPSLTIDIGKDDEQWESVKEYLDFTGDCPDRDSRAMAGEKRYSDQSGRNDIASVKVARDGEYLYFRVETADEITPYEDGDVSFMNVWLKTRNAAETYFGYDYALRRSGEGYDVCRAKNGALEKTSSADFRIEGKTLFLRVKRADLGLGENDYDVEFKVTDHVSVDESGKYLDFYRTGDSAPIGRLNYKFGY